MARKSVQLEVPHEKMFLYALSCQDPIHKLAWHINTNCHFSFRENNPLEFSKNHFPTIKDDQTNPFSTFIIVSNRVEQGVLFKEIQNVDYILKIQGNISELKVKSIISSFKNVSAIAAIIPLNEKSLKNVRIIANA